MELRELFLKQKEAVRKRTRTIFPLLPRERVTWAPVEGALPLGHLLRHVWHSETGVRELLLHDRWDYYERRIPEGLFAILGEPKSIDEEVAKLEQVHSETMLQIAKMPPDLMDREFTNEQFSFRRKGYAILFGIIEHEVHHRAQLLTYLRMLGIAGPGP